MSEIIELLRTKCGGCEAICEDAADEIERWKNEASKKDAELTIVRDQLASAERTIETMDKNHRSMASLLADTGRERDKLAKQLVSARSEALEECAKISDHNWSLMFTKAENRDVARKVAAAISKSIRDQIPHLTDDVREEPGYTQYTSFRP